MFTDKAWQRKLICIKTESQDKYSSIDEGISLSLIGKEKLFFMMYSEQQEENLILPSEQTSLEHLTMITWLTKLHIKK